MVQAGTIHIGRSLMARRLFLMNDDDDERLVVGWELMEVPLMV